MTQVIDLIARMRALRGKLPKSEQIVADFMLANINKTTFLSQYDIAQGAGVSVATVNRFSISAGCVGFRDFKIRLAQSVAISQQYLESDHTNTSEAGHLVNQVFAVLFDSLTLARNQLKDQPIEKATTWLNAANRIAFMGVGGGSTNVAREAANRFFRLGIPSESHVDGYLQRMLASTLTVGDLVFAISATGQPAELLDSVAIARQYGARTISLTKAGSELSIQTDLSIQIDLTENPDIYKPSASRFVFLAIIDVLATGTAHKRPEVFKENLRRIRTSLLPLSGDTSPKPVGD